MQKMTFPVVTNIIDFSDDILLHIFLKLSSSDLLNLLGTCRRLRNVGIDHSLWKRVDLTDSPLSASQVSRQVLKCLHQLTTEVRLKGHKRTNPSKWKTDLITPNILKKLGTKCPLLTNFSIKEALVNARKLKLVNFQEVKSVGHLEFVDCEFINLPSPTTEGSYFKQIANYLPNLKSLEISYSNWITDYDLMVLSKLDSLKILNLKCDLRIGFATSYLAISFRFGFKGLEELDMRGTSLRNMEIQSVAQCGRLKCLKLGPMGRVKRLKNDLDEGFGLVIPDPRWQDEPKQQVVVIDMSANGPEWRRASDNDLEILGLHWLKNRLKKIHKNVEKDDEHFFFGKEGKIVKSEKSDCETSSSGECSSSNKKRKRHHDDSSEVIPSKRRLCEDNSEEDSDSTHPDEDDDVPPIPTDESSLPDELLSDLMTHCLSCHCRNLRRLELNGCAITDVGLIELIECLPELTYLDVSNSHVTKEALQRAKILASRCSVILNSISPEDGSVFLK